ncbi:hypothetical protein AB0I91_07850 [Actinosynnema sp. NPDC049800]
MMLAVKGDPGHVLEPARIETLAELANAFTQLLGTRTQASLTKAAEALPVRDGRKPALPKSTLSDLLGGKSMPSRDTVVTFLTVCGLPSPQDQQPWLVAWERISTAHLRRPPGAVRVRDARAQWMGVHTAIRLPDDPTSSAQPDRVGLQGAESRTQDELPAYVSRDLDDDLRAKLTGARERGGFVLLIGDSSVGKTRALFEALRDVVPEWWLLHPADAVAVSEFAAAPTDRTVVWLDELQDYLNHPHGLPAATIRSLVSAGTVVAATLWPDEYESRTEPRIPGQSDRYANDRQLLKLAEIIAVPDEFSPNERQRAEDLADTDLRIRIALNTPDAGFTQVMAAGPQLIHHWEHAPAKQCYGKAVITAALDARRVGAQAPLTWHYLAAAVPGYLTPAQQAKAPADWEDKALSYATMELHGAASALAPVSSGMGQVSGYDVADYLYQHSHRIRRTVHLPDVAWEALVNHHHANDTLRLAGSAERRGYYMHAETLYWRAINTAAGSGASAVIRLADLLTKLDRVGEAIGVLQLYAGAEPSVANHLARLMAELDRVDDATIAVLRDHADADHSQAGTNEHVGRQLVDLLLMGGRGNEAFDWLHDRADTESWAADRLAELYLELGCVDEAIAVLRPHASTDPWVAFALAPLLSESGSVDEAIALLRPHADTDPPAASALADLLAKHDRIDELTQLATTKSWAAFALAPLLAEQDLVDEALAVVRPYPDATNALAEILAKRGRIDKLAELATISPHAVTKLAKLLVERGRVDDAITALRPHADTHPWAAGQMAELLTEQGRVDEAIIVLRPHTDASPMPGLMAASQLVALLAKHDRIDELAAEAAAGTYGAAEALRALRPHKAHPDKAR